MMNSTKGKWKIAGISIIEYLKIKTQSGDVEKNETIKNLSICTMNGDI